MEINSNIAAATIAADIELVNEARQTTPVKESKPVQESKRSEKSPELSEEQAKQEAKELEALLNKPADTEIKFNVKLISTSDSGEKSRVTDFKFQVVEKDTGKVVRQFPPEDINGMKERAKTTPATPGIFINSVA